MSIDTDSWQIELFASIIVVGGFVVFARARSLRFLHMLQQDDYDTGRFVSWFLRTMRIDRYVTAALVFLSVMFSLGENFDYTVGKIVVGLGFVAASLLEANPRVSAKKVLVLTMRAKRIWYTALLLCALVAVLVNSGSDSTWWWIVSVQLIPLLLCVANLLLRPVETRIRNKYKAEAVARLRDVKPTVIAITGSYGKTSIKHIVGHLLGMGVRAIATPGSVNTQMGVTRFIREQLTTGVDVFVTEMGAYRPGSIRSQCEFTPPDVGIISAIGPSHLERYKTIDNVAIAKFELAEAVLANPQGRLIISNQAAAYGDRFEFYRENTDRVTVVGRSNGCDVRITDITQTDSGLVVAVVYDGVTHEIESELFGEHHGENMALAFATAMVMGQDPEAVKIAFSTVPQIKHRLEVKATEGHPTYIDDSFNSNPTGFRSAVELANRLTPKGGRTILVTPGIVELGADHHDVHYELGKFISPLCDVVILIGGSRFSSFGDGIDDCEPALETHDFDHFSEANVWLRSNTRQGDVVLIENDLPDVLNEPFSI